MHSEMTDFLEILEGKEKAAGTIARYRKGLEQFSDWIASEDVEIEEVSTRDVQRYLSFLKREHEFAPKTLRVKFTAVSQFYADLTNNGITGEDPTDSVRIGEYAPKTTKREEHTKTKHIWLTEEEVSELVEHVPPPTLRNRLVVFFQYFTGLRRQEVVDVRLGDLDREDRRVRVRGKGNKTHVAYWQSQLDGLLAAWLDGGYRDSSLYARESDYLFLTESTPQLSANRVSYIVREAAENAGMQEILYVDAEGREMRKITSHTLRHSFAMHYLKNGGTIDGLSKLLAHSSVKTTEIYGELLDEQVQEDYQAHGPDIDVSF